MKERTNFSLEKGLQYLFWAFAGFMLILTLLDMSVYLGIGSGKQALLRGWVSYQKHIPGTEAFEFSSGDIKMFTMEQSNLAMVNFDHFGSLLNGWPLAATLSLLLHYICIILIFHQLARIFQSLSRGQVFRINNNGRIRWMAFTVFAVPLFKFFHSLFLANYLQTLGGAFIETHPSYRFENVFFGALGAAIILSLAKAFQLGFQLQQEQDLTI
ncbi:MAG: DUF2975 domain-containing protein [Saprospiraceae bacterium]|nr:DUF2975 domain-containing protein [Saprospiraceae bacterium]